MSSAGDNLSPDVRQRRKAELDLVLFRHGFEIVDNDAGTVYVRVATTHSNSAGEPMMLDYKRDVANYVRYGFGTPHDIAMHFVHRYAFRAQAWVRAQGS
jgi:hypothetical protein